MVTPGPVRLTAALTVEADTAYLLFYGDSSVTDQCQIWLPFGYQRYKMKLLVAKRIQNSKAEKSLRCNTFCHFTKR